MPFDARQFNKRVLLTGAGFSRNWGGRLPKEVWQEIFSDPDVQKRPSLRTLLIQTPMFEDALAQITDTRTYDDRDRSTMGLAVQRVFQRMARVQRLRTLRDEGGHTYDVIACIAGRGFKIRREDMRRLLQATDGNVFTLSTMHLLIDFTRIRQYRVR